MSHVPAWKRIQIRQQQQQLGVEEEDALNVTTHLATSRSRGQHRAADPAQRIRKPAKREKLPSSERKQRTATVLRDQLRYLLDFYLEKAPDAPLPPALLQQPAVAAYLDARPSAEEAAVAPTWKFSKQKQNWLIKHLHDIDALPSAYDPLLQLYLRGLGDRARDAVVARCTDTLRSWDEYTAAHEEHARRVADATAPDDNAPEPTSLPAPPCPVAVKDRCAGLREALSAQSPPPASPDNI
ncbi:AaceriAEL041Cp [[Ashbya] aceris (nom. inval.)]|nr:AaceriAEL041Cp [[Ashbya] aceris (nom. inval.)]